MASFKAVSYKGWQAYQCTAGQISAIMAPAIGGRILSLTFNNHELLYTQAKHHGEVFDFKHQDLNEEKRRLGFRVWGGDKTWVAPQEKWRLGIPPLELDAGQYTHQGFDNGIIMISPVCRETGLQIERRIQLFPDNRITLKEVLTNKSSKVVYAGIWNVTQIIRPCTIIIPAQANTIRSYHYHDKTLPPVKDLPVEDGQVRINCDAPAVFKYGGMPLKGECAIEISFNDKRIMWQRLFNVDHQASYAHHSAVEVFNSHEENYAEAEIHSPALHLQPGQSIDLEQTWLFTLLGAI